ncbi:elongation factor P hydroxylase [Thalassotalea litorea]|uniref:elongation factor P hydroxylase n=1 Tax=Thalassotalea litorea TaxID=2020715 RepID=UPI003735FF1A
MKSHDIDDLIALFDGEFSESENTRLIRGGDEPIYLPADTQISYHRVIFAHGFFASGLHEIAHWCIAGKARRLLEDFGYWYAPDGRDADQQTAFENVEIKPQAIEWAFCVAAGFNFNVSVDNLSGVEVDRCAFKHRVHKQVNAYIASGFPPRAQQFISALARFYDRDEKLNIKQFALKDSNNPQEPANNQSIAVSDMNLHAEKVKAPCYV